MSGVFPGMKLAEALSETSTWGQRPHFSQTTREMGHPFFLDDPLILDDELVYLNDFTAAVSSSLTSNTV
jgi:hypothetical protein